MNLLLRRRPVSIWCGGLCREVWGGVGEASDVGAALEGHEMGTGVWAAHNIWTQPELSSSHIKEKKNMTLLPHHKS